MSLVKSIELRCDINGHNKFYKISIDEEDGQYVVRATWGRLGRRKPNKESHIKGGPYASLEAANVHYQDLVLSKLKKGYQSYKTDDETSVPQPEPEGAVKYNRSTTWTRAAIDNDPAGFSKALRFALQQKGASI
jgi:predicted DNA-binding WGR domain protein